MKLKQHRESNVHDVYTETRGRGGSSSDRRSRDSVRPLASPHPSVAIASQVRGASEDPRCENGINPYQSVQRLFS